MLRQLYGPKQLAKVIRPKDVRRWNLWEHDRDRDEQLCVLAARIADSSYGISPLEVREIRGNAVCEPSCPEDFVALRVVDHYLRRIYKVRQSDRSRIVRELKVILKDSSDLELRKLDIRSFYESVSCDELINQIRSDMILGYKGIRILETLVERAREAGIAGLPRGIGVCATLSELVGRRIDRHIGNMEGVYYAARYVDDIILVTERRRSGAVEASLRDLWNRLGFEVNTDKAVAVELDAAPRFCYLGYEFTIGSQPNPGAPRTITVRIAPSKLRKQKTRICRAFHRFTRDKSFGLLLARLRYLMGSQLISRTENGLLFSGNVYNYREITEPDCLDALDALVRSITAGRGRLGRIVALQLSSDQVKRLESISFRHAYERNLKVRFTRSRAMRIKQVFRNA